MVLKTKKFNIKGVHQFLGEGGHKEQYIGRIAYKGVDWTTCRGQKRRRRVFLRDGVDTPLHTMT